MPKVRELSLTAPRPFDLALVLFGHGWVDLPPHRWDAGVFHTALDLGRRAVDAEVRAQAGKLRVRLHGARSDAEAKRALAALRHMLRMDEDLRPLWAICRSDPERAWVARRGAGRLLRSARVFEDLAKLLMTTNCNWSATRNMVTRVTARLGSVTPSGARAFPSAEVCAEQTEAFYRDEGRMGYRAKPMRQIAERFASGALRDRDFTDPALGTDELRERLLELPGFGPYAAGQALRLLGRYDDLALDSWCRAELAKRTASGRPPADRTVERRYAGFGPWRGLVLWMDLTAHWHGEAEGGSRPVLVARP